MLIYFGLKNNNASNNDIEEMKKQTIKNIYFK